MLLCVAMFLSLSYDVQFRSLTNEMGKTDSERERERWERERVDPTEALFCDPK